MGTTVSTNLGLIKPDQDESIKAIVSPPSVGWAAQNVINMNKIDALFRSSNTSYTVNLTATSVNPTLGTGGFTEGKTVRLWPRMVIMFFRIYMGTVTGFAAGTGSYRINLPFTMDNTMLAADPTRSLAIGRGLFKDVSAAVTSSILIPLYDPTNVNVAFGKANGGLLSNTDIGNDDRFTGYIMYPTSDA